MSELPKVRCPKELLVAALREQQKRIDLKLNDPECIECIKEIERSIDDAIALGHTGVKWAIPTKLFTEALCADLVGSTFHAIKQRYSAYKIELATNKIPVLILRWD